MSFLRYLKKDKKPYEKPIDANNLTCSFAYLSLTESFGSGLNSMERIPLCVRSNFWLRQLWLLLWLLAPFWLKMLWHLLLTLLLPLLLLLRRLLTSTTLAPRSITTRRLLLQPLLLLTLLLLSKLYDPIKTAAFGTSTRRFFYVEARGSRLEAREMLYVAISKLKC